MAKVTKDMLIAEVLQVNENMANILMREGMHCIGCPAHAPVREPGRGRHGTRHRSGHAGSETERVPGGAVKPYKIMESD